MVASTSSRITTNHEAIRRWAEERGAKPTVFFAGKGDDDPSNVRLEFPGSRDTSLREIGWNEWFHEFDKSKLALLYQEQTADGERSSFCKIVHRAKADEVENALGGRGRSAARRGSPRAETTARRSAAASAAGESARPSEPAAVLQSAATEKTADKSARTQKAGTTRASKKSSLHPASARVQNHRDNDGKDNLDGPRESYRSTDDAQ
jgi:hypothetical protein